MTDRSGGLTDTGNAEPRIEIGFATHVGQVRTGNEDNVLCEPLESLHASERGLFCAVADGMGGHAAGEVASSMAVQVARDAYYTTSTDADPLELLRVSVARANVAVYEEGAGKTGRDHMGTTLTAAVLLNGRVVVGHVGDSRCYIVRGDNISQISKDHSWVAEEVAAGRMTPEQARVSPRRNIITRALGLRPDVDVDSYQEPLEPGNIVVICSDGLHGLVTEDEILWRVRRHRPEDAVNELVTLANQRGGPDNISVVVARVLGDDVEEADTQRGFPVLTDAYSPTEKADLSALQDSIETAPAVPRPDPPPPPSPPAPDPPTRQWDDALPDPAPRTWDDPAAADTQTGEAAARSWEEPAADSPGPSARPWADQADETSPALDGDDPPTPRHLVPERMLAPAASPPARIERQQRGGRSGGLILIVILLLMILLGSAIGYLLFQMAGIIR